MSLASSRSTEKLEPDAKKISDNAGATSKHLTINSPFHWADLQKNGAGCKKLVMMLGQQARVRLFTRHSIPLSYLRVIQ
jgi:hypothetical protein